MTSVRTLVKNTGWLFIASIISNIVGFVLIVLIARFLGDKNLGIYSFAFALTSMFALLFDFGLNAFSLKQIARDKSQTEKYYWNVATIKLFAGSLAVIFPIIILYFYGADPFTIKIVSIAAVGMFFNYYTSMFKMMFQAYEVMEYDAFTIMIERLSALIIGALVLLLGGGLLIFIIVISASYFIYFLISYLFVSKKICKLSLKFDFRFWKIILKKSLPFWFTLLFLKIYFQIDTIMLSAIKDYAVTGLYNAAYSLVNGITFIAILVVTVTFPTMSILHIKNPEYLRTLYNRVFNYLFMVGFPIVVGTMILSKKIILLFYKEAFINSSLVLQVLIWSELFLFVNYLMGTLLNSIDKQKLFTFGTGVCVIINISLNFILIPLYSYIGAAIATVITEIVNFVILYYFTSKSGYSLNLCHTIIKPVIATLIMGFIVYLLMDLNILIIIPLGAIIYFLILVLSKAIGKEELDLIKSLLHKKK